MKLHRTLTQGIILFTAVFFLTLFMTGTIHSKDEVKLTPDYLASGKWILEGENITGKPCSGEAKFTKDGRFTMFRDCSHHESEIDISGSYKIDGNKLIYTVEKSPEGTEFEKGYKGTAILTDKDSIKYKWYLQSDKLGNVYNHNTLIKESEIVSVNGIDAISTGVKKGTVTNVLKIRGAPNASAKEVNFYSCVSGETVTAKSIEKGKELTIYARTKEKEQVGKWNNHWYYIEFYSDNCEGPDSVTGWVFGEFVKIK